LELALAVPPLDLVLATPTADNSHMPTRATPDPNSDALQ
jgi:hypothetical protein